MAPANPAGATPKIVNGRPFSRIEVPTTDGRISLKVPPGSQDGKLLQVRGHGAPRLKGSGRGDLLARVRVSVPTKLTKAEREALEQLRKVSREDPRQEKLGA